MSFLFPNSALWLGMRATDARARVVMEQAGIFVELLCSCQFTLFSSITCTLITYYALVTYYVLVKLPCSCRLLCTIVE